MEKSQLLMALSGQNDYIPVWFMRQAGRYLPEYQALKVKYSLDELFQTPDLAAEITCMPIHILGVDAAILFADILTLPGHMGFDIHFDNQKGPCIADAGILDNLHDYDDIVHIRETIRLIKQKLPQSIPLIGFAGSPFTVLTYLIEGGSSVNFAKTIRFIEEKPGVFHQAMKKLTKNTIRYLNLQKDSGINVYQVFDSWAGILRPTDYAHWVLPYVQEIFEAVDLPSIYFTRNSHHLLPLIDQCGSDFLSVDHTIVLGHHSIIEKTRKGIQGNLYNGLLFADDKTLEKEVHDVLVGGSKHERFIFNLSHGVLPQTSVDKLKKVVDQVHQFRGAHV